MEGLRAAADVKMKLTHGDHQLSLLEELDKDLYTLQFIAGSGFRAGNPSIVWQPLPGSEDIAEGAPRDQGARLLLTAKAAGRALFSVTAEGIGTMVFPVTVGEGRIGLILVAAENMPYTGQEITPLVLVFSDTGPIMTEGVHYQVTYADNIRCGLARAEITGIGRCGEREEGATHVEYFTIVPGSPEMASLEAGSGEIRLSVTDLSDTGADGYEAQYRMKGSKEWVTAVFEAGRTDLVISGLEAGEYEIQARAFVDNTADSVPEESRKTAYGQYGGIRAVTVP